MPVTGAAPFLCGADMGKSVAAAVSGEGPEGEGQGEGTWGGATCRSRSHVRAHEPPESILGPRGEEQAES